MIKPLANRLMENLIRDAPGSWRKSNSEPTVKISIPKMGQREVSSFLMGCTGSTEHHPRRTLTQK